MLTPLWDRYEIPRLKASTEPNKKGRFYRKIVVASWTCAIVATLAIGLIPVFTIHKVLRLPEGSPFWQPRYYDFNVWTDDKRIEKLRYIHRNPVKRGLVERPEHWAWSSFRHYATAVEGVVEIESQWTARKRERAGTEPKIICKNQNPHPVAQTATRMGHPQK